MSKAVERKKTVLVTGGAGFIGSYVVDLVVKKGWKAVIIDDMSRGRVENVNRAAKLYKIDLRDQEKIGVVFKKEKPSLVYYLASSVVDGKSLFSPVEVTSRNYDAFIKTLTVGINNGVKRLVYISSASVYGRSGVPFKESDLVDPWSIYGVSKFACEQSLRVMAKVHGFEYVMVRPHNVYGPRQNMTDPYGNIVMLFMNSLLSGKPYYIYGDGKSVTRCFSYVTDVAEGIFKCGYLPVSGKIINLGSDREVTLGELSELVQKVSGINIEPVHEPMGVSLPDKVKVDHGLAKKYLKYRTKVDLEEGILRTWEYAKKQGHRRLIFEDLEIPSPKVPVNWRKGREEDEK